MPNIPQDALRSMRDKPLVVDTVNKTVIIETTVMNFSRIRGACVASSYAAKLTGSPTYAIIYDGSVIGSVHLSELIDRNPTSESEAHKPLEFV
jgi:hypothetical protein